MNYIIKKDQVANRACGEGLEKAEKAYPGWQELDLSQILESNGVMDAIWCLRYIDVPYKVELFAAEIVNLGVNAYEKVYSDDYRIRNCVQATFDYIFGLITIEEIREKREAAADAADAAYAAYAAYRAAYAVYCAADAACRAAYAAYRAADAAYAADAADAAYAIACDKEKIKELYIKFFCK